MLDIQFRGAAGTVTGSQHLITYNETKIMIDCGMFQGSPELNARNWREPQIDLKSINFLLVTHAHIDHIGLIPRLVKLGLECPIYCSKPTMDLARLMLLDAGRLQEEDAEYRAKHQKSQFETPLPLFTEEEAEKSLEYFKTIEFDQELKLAPDISATWTRTGHIIGAGSINLKIADKELCFSGDLGRYNSPILVDPQPVTLKDLLVIEATYGDRLHAELDPKIALRNIIEKALDRNGVVVIPSFAVGRAQLLLYYLRQLQSSNDLPDVPVVIDSPMAGSATEIYQKYVSEYDQEIKTELNKGINPFECPNMHYIKNRQESIELNDINKPMIIISASGMLTGGRILHHLKHRISEKKNMILFVGYQPPESKGDLLKKGAKHIKLVGDYVPVRAEIASISGLSAHGDQEELLRWCKSCNSVPKKTVIVHAESEGAKGLQLKLQNMGWDTTIAKENFTLSL